MFIRATLLFSTLLLTTSVVQAAPDKAAMAELGQQLFFDTNLSANRSQSCASCHNPAAGFTDHRGSGAAAAASLGDDGHSLGDRNAPSAAYAKFSPRFHQRKDGEYVGGQFWDGRAANLAEQAGGPPLNPAEMGMPDKALVLARLQENPTYVASFTRLFGEKVLDDVDTAYSAMAQSVAEFEKTAFFAPFDSKYDRYLRGEAQLTEQEQLGETLFFSQQFTNCNRCHQLKRFGGQQGETFSNYEFHNLGVPANTELRVLNGMPAHTDTGLLNNPAVAGAEHAGKFKVPTLRNVAVTGPYMHNGVFKNLRTVVMFYDQYNNRSRTLNPETGEPWRVPEVAQNLALQTREFKAPALTDQKLDALVAFLKTLTDQRYEHLLDK